MKKKLVLKPFVLPTLYILMVIALMVMSTTLIYKGDEEDDLTYVSDSIFDNTLPVVGENEIVILKPFTSDKVSITSSYYNYQAESSSQENSIIRYDDTYLQNSGITYSSDEEFDIVSVMDGTVTKIYYNELLGNIVEITHDKNLISVYQMLDDISVKVEQKVTRGEVIAKSGSSKITSSNYNLHFELMKDGNIVDPNTYIGKNIKEL